MLQPRKLCTLAPPRTLILELVVSVQPPWLRHREVPTKDWLNAEKVASVANLLFKSLRDKARVELESLNCGDVQIGQMMLSHGHPVTVRHTSLEAVHATSFLSQGVHLLRISNLSLAGRHRCYPEDEGQPGAAIRDCSMPPHLTIPPGHCRASGQSGSAGGIPGAAAGPALPRVRRAHISKPQPAIGLSPHTSAADDRPWQDCCL